MTEGGNGKKRGGYRKGAGRPRKESKLVSFRVSGPVAKYIEGRENKTVFIKQCILCAMQKELPALKWGSMYPASQVNDVQIPFFDIGIVAGFPIPLDNDERAQNIDLLRMLCSNMDSTYLIRVEGYSMIDAGITSGDIVIVDKSNRNPSETQVAVCEYNGEYTLKHFVMRDGVGYLVPANPDFPEIRLKPEDDFRIWGTVTYVIHKPR